uniref:Uncharacterized protein n=1 Tax=Octopus bimaculoides TaxID=37653 RepID=A0A0L8G0K2_OCTBM
MSFIHIQEPTHNTYQKHKKNSPTPLIHSCSCVYISKYTCKHHTYIVSDI